MDPNRHRIFKTVFISSNLTDELHHICLLPVLAEFGVCPRFSDNFGGMEVILVADFHPFYLKDYVYLFVKYS